MKNLAIGILIIGGYALTLAMTGFVISWSWNRMAFEFLPTLTLQHSMFFVILVAYFKGTSNVDYKTIDWGRVISRAISQNVIFMLTVLVISSIK